MSLNLSSIWLRLSKQCGYKLYSSNNHMPHGYLQAE